MQRLIEKNVHETKNDNITRKSENGESLCFNCNGINFFCIDLENPNYSQELENGNEQHCDNIICSENLCDIAIWIEFKGTINNLKVKKALGQIETSLEKFGQNINKNYAVIIANNIYSHPKTKTALQDLQTEWEENDKKLFIREKTMNLQYNSNNQTISTC